MRHLKRGLQRAVSEVIEDWGSMENTPPIQGNPNAYVWQRPLTGGMSSSGLPFKTTRGFDQFARQRVASASAEDRHRPFSAKNALKQFGWGIISPITALFQSTGAFLAGAAMIGAGIGVTALGGAPILIAAGVGFGLWESVQFVSRLLKAPDTQGREEAFHHLGAACVSLIPSVLSAKSALQGLLPASDIAQMGPIGATIQNIRMIPATLGQCWQNLRNTRLLIALLGARPAAPVTQGVTPKPVTSPGTSNVVTESAESVTVTNPATEVAPGSTTLPKTLPKPVMDRIRADLAETYRKIGDLESKIKVRQIEKNIYTDEEVIGYLLRDSYDALRKHAYPVDFRHNSLIHELSGKDTPLIRVKHENNWHYRLPKDVDTTGLKTVDRFSLNVNADERLLVLLDELFASGKVKGYYKTPELAEGWLARHDPITVYLYEPTNPIFEQELATLVKPFIRSGDDVLMGRTVAPGITMETSPSLSAIETALQQADAIDPILGKGVRKYLELPDSTELRASTGQMYAINQMLARYGAAG